MNIKLDSDLTESVLALKNEYGYAPDEILSMGLAMAAVVLKERRIGNRVVVVTPEGGTVAEFKEVEPRAISEMVKEYVRSICPEMAAAPAALLVARLEHERDLAARRRT